MYCRFKLNLLDLLFPSILLWVVIYKISISSIMALNSCTSIDRKESQDRKTLRPRRFQGCLHPRLRVLFAKGLNIFSPILSCQLTGLDFVGNPWKFVFECWPASACTTCVRHPPTWRPRMIQPTSSTVSFSIASARLIIEWYDRQMSYSACKNVSIIYLFFVSIAQFYLHEIDTGILNNFEEEAAWPSG